MDWNQSTMYEQRVRFILEVQQRTFSFAESCRRYSISRAAGYKWWTRFLAEGFEGLHDRSHRPHHCPHAVRKVSWNTSWICVSATGGDHARSVNSQLRSSARHQLAGRSTASSSVTTEEAPTLR